MQSSADRFLGGRISARQNPDGFRSGTDAVMLAASVPAQAGEAVLELGSGAGIASLCVAARVPECRVDGVEFVSGLVDLARANARANGMEQRLSFIQADALELPRELRRSYDHTFCNPPFHEHGNVSPSAERARALQDCGRLGDWLIAALRRVRSNGTLTAIIRADRLDESLRVLPSEGVTIFPLWPRAGEAAKRVIVQVLQNSRAPLVLLPGLMLHDANGRYTEAAEDVLRRGGSLALGSRRL